jgi:PAS domain S-box-containing protein
MDGYSLIELLPGLNTRKPAKTSMQHHADLFRLLVDSLSEYVITLLDEQGNILTWSAAGERMKQYQTEEIVGKSFAIFYPPEDIRQGKAQKHLEEAAAKGRCDDEGWRLRKDGSRFWAHVVITALRDKAGRLCGFGTVSSDQTNRKQAEADLRSLTEKLDHRVQERTHQLAKANRELRALLAQLRALAARLQAVREDERTSIAREIHDDLGQTLTAMNMDLVWLMQRLLGQDPAWQQKVHSVLKLVDDAITSVRRIASSLRPGMLDDLGLSAAIEWQTREFQARTGIECELVLPAKDVVLDDDHSTAIFRIFQETLTNIARHACATRAIVRLKKVRQAIVLEVLDNGKGFDNGAIAQKKSLGLLGMKERALILGGLIEICSKPGQGTSVTVRIPLGHAKLRPESNCE